MVSLSVSYFGVLPIAHLPIIPLHLPKWKGNPRLRQQTSGIQALARKVPSAPDYVSGVIFKMHIKSKNK